MAFSFLQRGSLTESARQLSLSSYVPTIVLENLVGGMEPIRHDVFISSKFTEIARLDIFKLIVNHGNVEDLAAEDPPAPARRVARPLGRVTGPGQGARNLSPPGKEI